MKRLLLAFFVFTGVLSAKTWVMRYAQEQILVPAEQRLAIEDAVAQYKSAPDTLFVVEGAQQNCESVGLARRRATELADIALAYQIPRSAIRVLTPSTRNESSTRIYVIKNKYKHV